MHQHAGGVNAAGSIDGSNVSDIFISYASADRERAKVVAEALAARGLSVWWDRNIPPGRQFDEVIEEALDAARCVVVLWSQASTASTWVKTEAAEAMRGKALIPAIIEEGVQDSARVQAAPGGGPLAVERRSRRPAAAAVFRVGRSGA